MKLLHFVGLVVGWGLIQATPSFAVTALQKVQIQDSQVELTFDGKINPKQVRVEYLRDIIQLSLNDVSVYPAKIANSNNHEVSKVFAYQYSPKLVRCRVSVRGKAESYAQRVQLKPEGKSLILKIGSRGEDAVQASQSSAARAEPAQAEKSTETKTNDPDEAALLERVMKGEPSQSGQALSQDSKRPLASGKSLPSPWKSIGMLGLVCVLFCGVALGIKRFKKPNIQAHRGLSRFLKGIGGVSLNSLRKRDKLIEVMATHYLGPKKSIAVVKVSGRTLVLGVTNESINLISQLSEESAGILPSDLTEGHGEEPTAGATAAGKAVFSDLMGIEAAKPAATRPSMRAQIRSRVEGLKPL